MSCPPGACGDAFVLVQCRRVPSKIAAVRPKHVIAYWRFDLIKSTQTEIICSSEASVDTDFELIKVDVWRRKTDWKDGVSVHDWTAET